MDKILNWIGEARISAMLNASQGYRQIKIDDWVKQENNVHNAACTVESFKNSIGSKIRTELL